jgi:hypothetical protein
MYELSELMPMTAARAGAQTNVTSTNRAQTIMMPRKWRCYMGFPALFIFLATASAWSVKNTNVARAISTGYRQRVAADTRFPEKAVAEFLIAAGTQLTAEWNRRGTFGLKNEVDFVVAGVLTACYGKFYSMWRVAPTEALLRDDDDEETSTKVFDIIVPTNAFQTTIDGQVVPTVQQRLLSFVAPVPALFKAGCVASLVAYGITAILISLRSWLVPSYIAATANVNIFYASLYTGTFMAVVSNLRYQVLQGIIEPRLLDKHLKRHPALHATAVFAVRLANGLLGSALAIAGMQALRLQELKR